MENKGHHEEQQKQTIIINQPQNQTNTAGLVGLILAIISWFTSCFPIIGFLLWLLGAIFSVIGLFKQPRGVAIAGTIISFLGLILLLLFFLGIFGTAMTAAALEGAK